MQAPLGPDSVGAEELCKPESPANLGQRYRPEIARYASA